MEPSNDGHSLLLSIESDIDKRISRLESINTTYWRSIQLLKALNEQLRIENDSKKKIDDEKRQETLEFDRKENPNPNPEDVALEAILAKAKLVRENHGKKPKDERMKGTIKKEEQRGKSESAPAAKKDPISKRVERDQKEAKEETENTTKSIIAQMFTGVQQLFPKQNQLLVSLSPSAKLQSLIYIKHTASLHDAGLLSLAAWIAHLSPLVPANSPLAVLLRRAHAIGDTVFVSKWNSFWKRYLVAAAHACRQSEMQQHRRWSVLLQEVEQCRQVASQQLLYYATHQKIRCASFSAAWMRWSILRCMVLLELWFATTAEKCPVIDCLAPGDPVVAEAQRLSQCPGLLSLRRWVPGSTPENIALIPVRSLQFQTLALVHRIVAQQHLKPLIRELRELFAAVESDPPPPATAWISALQRYRACRSCLLADGHRVDILYVHRQQTS